MNQTRVTVLTPPGTGAIATIRVAGTSAWAVGTAMFRPATGTLLPAVPTRQRIWFGHLGDGIGDEVVLAVKEIDPEPVLEIHCHGGRRVVAWIVEQLQSAGCVSRQMEIETPWDVLAKARTVRTASILLDQCQGAFARAIQAIIDAIQASDIALAQLRVTRILGFSEIGRHLVEPWKVVVAGAPNAGKSSLMNALAGYTRSVVSPVPGTTRDVVSAALAFDGWPISLSDTAGLRVATDSLEASGVEVARRFLREADLIVWLLDSTEADPVWPTDDVVFATKLLLVKSKIDLPAAAWVLKTSQKYSAISTITGDGIDTLIAQIVKRLVPIVPEPDEAVPYSSQTADALFAAGVCLKNSRADEAIAILRSV